MNKQLNLRTGLFEPSYEETRDGYFDFIKERLSADKHRPYLITFMFNEIAGSENTKKRIMEKTIQDTYARVLLRTCWKKNIKTIGLLDMPIWIAVPDKPVYKKNKKMRVEDIKTNQGLHYHCIALHPIKSNRKNQSGLNTLFNKRKNEIYGSIEKLRYVDCKKIKEGTGFEITDYVFKTVKTKNASFDDIIVLPRTHCEMPSNLKRTLVGFS